MIIKHNMNAANALRQLNINTNDQAKSTEKLSSGLRINRAGDDAAGLSISEKMRGQVSGLQRASLNAQDGISLIQTAEGALNEVHSILQRMRELAVQAANETNATDDVNAIQAEIEELLEEIDRIASTTEFNGKQVLYGDVKDLTLQIGANEGQVLKLSIDTFDADTLEVADVNVLDTEKAQDAITSVDDAIKKVSEQRSSLGAKQNRLEHTIKNLDNAAENLQTAESRIRDVDMADEMIKYTSSQVLSQAAQSMLAQANQAPAQVLSLLQ